MKPSLVVGICTKRRIVVERDRTIGFMGEQARVYATPMLLSDVEYTARDMLMQHLDAGEDSVGTRVELDHLAPTLLNMWVDIAVKVVEVKGRAVTVEFSARDALDEIGRGRHGRFVVDVKQTQARLAAKATKLAGAAKAAS
jgi:predicted thioesterase